MTDLARLPDGRVAKHSWCVTHGQPTSQWPGSWGQRCAWSRNDCETELRRGVVTVQGGGRGPMDLVDWVGEETP